MSRTRPSSTLLSERIAADQIGLKELVQIAADLGVTGSCVLYIASPDLCSVTSTYGDQRLTTPELDLCRLVADQETAVLADEISVDPRFPSCAGSVKSLLGIPIDLLQGAARGSLCLFNTEPRSFSQQQLKALAALARRFEARWDLQAKQALFERALRQSQQIAALCASTDTILAAFVENSPFASFIKNEEGRLLFCNKPMKKRLAIKGDDWLGRSEHELWPKDIADTIRLNDLDILTGTANDPLHDTGEIDQAPIAREDRWYLDVHKFCFRDASGALMLGGIAPAAF